MEQWIEAGLISEFEEKDRKTISGAVIFFDGKEFTACENRCPHMGYPMNKGTVRDGVVTCAWHNWQFDMQSGGCYRGACDDLQVYPVKVEDGRVLVQITKPYEHFAMQAARLVEGMMSSDRFLQAKAIALMLKCEGTVEDAVMVALEQAFRHSQSNHRNFQAVYELQAIGDAMNLAKFFSPREQVGILLQGIMAAAGPSGDRSSVTRLPEDAILFSKMKKMLSRYAIDSSPVAVERLLLNAIEQGMEKAAAGHILEIVTEADFLPVQEALVCCSAIAYYSELLDLTRFTPAFYAWSIANRRAEPDIETSSAISWLRDHREDICAPAFLKNSELIDVEEVQEAVSGNSAELIFENILGFLNRGVSPEALLDCFSLISARRFSRIPINNGGLWNTATEGVRYAHALRRMNKVELNTFSIKALFHMGFYFFKSRWIKFSGKWPERELASEKPFKECFEENNVKNSVDSALKLVAEKTAGWQKELLGPILKEDNSTLQLNTITAVLGELEHQNEWQHYISGLVTYACDMKMGQNVNSAAKFGRSYLSEAT